jgi:hypothetical protein
VNADGRGSRFLPAGVNQQLDDGPQFLAEAVVLVDRGTLVQGDFGISHAFEENCS